MGFKIQKPKGGPTKNNCHKIWVYCIKNDRTDHTDEKPSISGSLVRL